MSNRELDTRSLIKIILALLLTILVVVFVLANIQDTRVNFLVFSMEGPLALVLFLTFAVGVATGILGSLAAMRRKEAKAAPAREPVREREEPKARRASPRQAQRSQRDEPE